MLLKHFSRLHNDALLKRSEILRTFILCGSYRMSSNEDEFIDWIHVHVQPESVPNERYVNVHLCVIYLTLHVRICYLYIIRYEMCLKTGKPRKNMKRSVELIMRVPCVENKTNFTHKAKGSELRYHCLVNQSKNVSPKVQHGPLQSNSVCLSHDRTSII